MISKAPKIRFLQQAIVGLIIAIIGLLIQTDSVKAELVCSKSGSEFDFDGGYIFGGDPTSGMRAKLENSAYFGSNGTVAPETVNFSTLATVNASTLAACDIFIGGGFEENLSAAEGTAIATWVNGSERRVVIGGCDLQTNQTCTKLNRTLNQFGSGAGVTLTTNIAYNPLTCGGAGTVQTFGGQASNISTLASDSVLAIHNGGVFAGGPAATTDSVLDPTFLITADADMFGSSGNATITDSPTANNPQALFILNVFKFALDGIKQRLDNPTCYDDYNRATDLALSLSATTTDLNIGDTTVFTLTVDNQSAELTERIKVFAPIPTGFTFSGQSGDGTYDPATGVWTIGSLAGGGSVTIDVTMTAASGAVSSMQAQISDSNLPDSDSAPNAGFGEDDLSDGIIDDDEASVDFKIPTPFACDGTLYQIATANSTLKALTFVAGTEGYDADLQDIGGVNEQINAGWGYNEVDNLIYGVKSGTRELYRIDASGDFTLITTLGNGFQPGGNAGDILPNGTMIYKRNTTRWQAMDISDPLVPVDLGEFTFASPGVNAVDIGINPLDGNMYGVDGAQDRLFYVDVSGTPGPRTPVYFGPATYTGAYGAAWFDEDGRLYLYDNNSNEISVVNAGINGNGTGDSTVLATSETDEGGINDGAYCRGPAPVPLGAISGTLFVDSDSSDIFESGVKRPSVLASLLVCTMTTAPR